MEQFEKDKKTIKIILGKKHQPKLSDDFTQKLMQKVLTIEISKKRDIKRSWYLFYLGIVAFLISLGFLSKLNAAVAPVFDELLPGLFTYYLVALSSVIVLMFLYQLNSLLTLKMSITLN